MTAAAVTAELAAAAAAAVAATAATAETAEAEEAAEVSVEGAVAAGELNMVVAGKAAGSAVT
eukprot:CAMPEP_0119331148 /NCGR_PEP_ID=MMETSP1333-20130426/79922_1 /TAXON_ID=418940 /ORGANISM="Scyphosphaera apsteinii, Strain RCC1455" /LENGTH=61 /DNA_ID=CAMNT_0007340675 /DNA_START=36 /DNA_END=217 /DNA_ORIENTATION=+